MARSDAGTIDLSNLSASINIKVDNAEFINFAKTLKEVAKGNDITEYWNSVEDATKKAIKALNKYKNDTENEEYATNLIKSVNALKALTNQSDEGLSNLLKDSNIEDFLASAKKIAPTIQEAFSVENLRSAFSSLEQLKKKGIDVISVLRDLSNYKKTSSKLYEMKEKLSKIENLFDIDYKDDNLNSILEKVQSYKDEAEKIRNEASQTFESFLNLNGINYNDANNGYIYDQFFSDIRNGVISASEAISRFKTEYSYLLDNDNIDISNRFQFENFSEKLSEALNEIKNVSEKVENILNATSSIASAIEEFSNANKDVKSSASASESSLEREAELMENIAKNAKEAAEAKEKFANANKEVKVSAEKSSNAVKSEDSAMQDLSETTNGLDKRVTKYVANESGNFVPDSKAETYTKNGSELTTNYYYDEKNNSWEKASEKRVEKFKRQAEEQEKLRQEAIKYNEVLDDALKIQKELEKDNTSGKKFGLSEEYKKTSDSINNIINNIKKGNLSENAKELARTLDEDYKKYQNLVKIQQDRDVWTYNDDAKKKENSTKQQENIWKKEASIQEKQRKDDEAFRKRQAKYETQQNKEREKQTKEKEKALKREQEIINELNKDSIRDQAGNSTGKNKYGLDEEYLKVLITISKSKEALDKNVISTEEFVKAINDAYKAYQKLVKIQQDRDVTDSKKQADEKDKLNRKYKNYQIDYDKRASNPKEQNSKYKTILNDYGKKLQEYKTLLNEIQNESIVTDSQLAQAKKLEEQLDEIQRIFKNMSASDKGSNELSRTKLANKVTEYLTTNSGMSKEFKREFNSILKDLAKFGSDANVSELTQKFLQLQNQVRSAGQEGKKFFDILKEKSLNTIIGQIASYFSFNDIVNYGQRAIQTVIELNAQLTDLAKVSEASTSQLYNQFSDFAEIAKEVGGTISDTISATSDWSRNGYNLDQAKELSRVALIYKNVGDGIDISSANESLISTLKGFKLEAEDAMHIIDVFNEVSNNEAISSAGIGQALKSSAASLNAANTSLEKSVALVTATNSVLQDTSKTGNMWKTVSARIRGASTELAEMGEDTEGMVESTSKLRSYIKGMTGFDIMKDKDTFKDIYDIVLGIGEKWQSLSDVNQAALLEKLAGKNQSNALAAALNNIDILKKSYKEAMNAEGSALDEQNEYQKSIQYSIDKTSASLEQLANDFISSDFVKAVVDFFDKIINGVDSLIQKFGTIPSLGVVLSAALSIGNVGRGKKFPFKTNLLSNFRIADSILVLLDTVV